MRSPPLLLACLLLAASLFVAPVVPAEPEPWNKSDPPGDVVVSEVPTSLPAPTYADLLSLTIHSEDELGLMMDIGLADFEAEADTSSISFGESSDLVLDFELAKAGVKYTLDLGLTGAVAPGQAPILNFVTVRSFCIDLGDGECRYGAPSVSVDYERNLVQVHFSKRELRGEATGVMVPREGRGFASLPVGSPEGEPADVDLGSQLVNFKLETRSETAFLPMSDRMPDQGVIADPYTMAFPTANTAFSLTIDSPGLEEYAVAAGKNQSIPFRISNEMGAKRIVRLSYEFRGEPADVAGYRVVAPANVSVPGHETREFRAYVLTPDVLRPVTFVIRGVSVGTEDLGVARVALVPGLPLGPDTPPLKILKREEESPVPDLTLCTACNVEGILYTSTEYGSYASEGTMPLPQGAGMGGGAFLQTPLRSADQLYLKPGAPVEVQLHAVSTHPQADVAIDLQLEYNGQSLLTGSQTKDVAPEGTVFTFTKVPKLLDKVLQSQGLFALRFAGSYQGSTPITDLGDVEIDLTKSWIKLPLAPVPEEYLEKPPPSPFQVAILGEREDFVNAGESRLFNLTILNFDAREQRLQVVTTASRPGWTVDVLPGRVFDLRPGDSVTVGVLVRPPPEGAEGETASILVNATADNGAATPVLLTAILTAYDVRDDTGHFVASEDDVKKQRDATAGGRADGAALGLTLAAAALGLGLRRRRPANP